MSRRLRRSAAVGAAGLLVVLAAGLVLGKGVLLDGKLRTGDTVVVAADETWDGDLYLLGGRVTVEGTVDGDLTALGGQVEINGTVTGDVLAAGGTVSVDGTVEGDTRIAGGQLHVGGEVGEDVAATGGQLTVERGATIGGDLIATGGAITLSGSVAGRVEGSAGSYTRSGSVGGSEHVVVSSRETAAPTAGETVFDAIRQFAVVVLLGALMLWLLPRAMAGADRVLRGKPLLALGGGLLVCVGYIGFLIVTIIAMVLLGLLFGLIRIGSLVAIEIVAGSLLITVVSFLFALAVVFVADAVVGLALARMTLKMVLPSRWRELGRLAAGAAAVVIITSIPIAGGWVKLVVVLLGMGALTIAGWDAWRARRSIVAAPEPG